MQITTDAGVIRIDGALRIAESEELRDALVRLLVADPAISLDLSGVEACDTSTVQLLCSLRNSASRSNKEISVIASSPAVSEVVSGLGLSLDDLSFRAEELGGTIA